MKRVVKAGFKLLGIPIFLFLLLSFAKPAYAESSSLDLEGLFNQPQVKLVVVDFYADWCKPCVDSVPHWQALHQKYFDKGLRLIVVSVGDAGSCSNPGWTPDRQVCDSNGEIQNRWQVRELPQAFIYAWNGDLLAERVDVDQAEKAIDRYFRNISLRINVDEVEVIGDRYAITGNPASIRDYIISQVRQQSKFDVVSAAEAPLRHARSKSCPMELPPNSTLRIRLAGDDSGNRMLTLDLERDGCILASSQKNYSGKKGREDVASLQNAAEQAVKDIIRQLIRIKAVSAPGQAVFRQSTSVPPKKNPRPFSVSSKLQLSVMEKAGYGLLGSGVGVAALGVIFHYLAKNEADSYKNDVSASKEEKIKTYNAVSVTGYAVGGTLASIGVVLLLLDLSTDKSTTSNAMPDIEIGGDRVFATWTY
ncbi:MAG: TlpA family protein disulfide reductase [Myxococcales bacterium]|nr:MAG: TlpA family protein disulfide reductase [Myxococcales bacterium]